MEGNNKKSKKGIIFIIVSIILIGAITFLSYKYVNLLKDNNEKNNEIKTLKEEKSNLEKNVKNQDLVVTDSAVVPILCISFENRGFQPFYRTYHRLQF